MPLFVVHDVGLLLERTSPVGAATVTLGDASETHVDKKTGVAKRHEDDVNGDGLTDEEEVVMGPSPDTGEPEHHEWRWVSFDEAHDLSAPRVREVVRWARQIIGT